MNLPYSYRTGFPLTIERCAPDSFGRTVVVCSFAGVQLPTFTLAQNVDVVGFDNLRPQIEALVIDQVQDALRLAS